VGKSLTLTYIRGAQMAIVAITVTLRAGVIPKAHFITDIKSPLSGDTDTWFSMTAELPSIGWQLFLLTHYPNVLIHEIDCRYNPAITSDIIATGNDDQYRHINVQEH
jgi:hypothetical protein